MNGRDILAQISTDEVPPAWHVFHISRKKLATLIFSFCIFMSLCMGFLTIYLVGNIDHHPPIPPTAFHAILTIMLVFTGGSFLLSLIIWITMKNRVLVFTSLGLVRGDWKKPKRSLCIAYQDITELSLNGSSVLIQRERNSGRRTQVDCRLFEASPQDIAFRLFAAYEDFQAKHTHGDQRKH